LEKNHHLAVDVSLEVNAEEKPNITEHGFPRGKNSCTWFTAVASDLRTRLRSSWMNKVIACIRTDTFFFELHVLVSLVHELSALGKSWWMCFAVFVITITKFLPSGFHTIKYLTRALVEVFNGLIVDKNFLRQLFFRMSESIKLKSAP